MEMKNNLHVRWLVMGGVVGGAIGLMTAYLVLKSAEEKQIQPKITAKKGMQMGLGVISLIRNFINSSQ